MKEIAKEFQVFRNTMFAVLAGSPLAGYTEALIKNFCPEMGTIKVPFKTPTTIPSKNLLNLGVSATTGTIGFVLAGTTVTLYEKAKTKNPALTFLKFIKNFPWKEFFSLGLLRSFAITETNFLTFMTLNNLLTPLAGFNSLEAAGVAVFAGLAIFTLVELFINKPNNLGASIASASGVFIGFAGAGLLLSQITNPSTFLQWMFPLLATVIALLTAMTAFGPYMGCKAAFHKCRSGFWCPRPSEMQLLLMPVESTPPLTRKEHDSIVTTLDDEDTMTSEEGSYQVSAGSVNSSI